MDVQADVLGNAKSTSKKALYDPTINNWTQKLKGNAPLLDKR